MSDIGLYLFLSYSYAVDIENSVNHVSSLQSLLFFFRLLLPYLIIYWLNLPQDQNTLAEC